MSKRSVAGLDVPAANYGYVRTHVFKRKTKGNLVRLITKDDRADSAVGGQGGLASYEGDGNASSSDSVSRPDKPPTHQGCDKGVTFLISICFFVARGH